MRNKRYNCKNCGRGFLAKANDNHAYTLTCKKAKCEKLSGIYKKPEKEIENCKMYGEKHSPRREH